MTELPNSVTDAQIKLRHDMRRDTDPRWHLLPVEPVKAPSRTPLWLWLVAVPLVGVALISIARGVF
jgi:hypothetical protein